MGGEPYRWTDKRVFHVALNDAIDWNVSLLDALSKDDEHREYVQQLLARLRKVRSKYFGEHPEPFAGAELVSLDELRRRSTSDPAP